jgi:2-amino-4-hydroxy-6-hydroxymethyldihydropteridine diphosphokinase
VAVVYIGLGSNLGVPAANLRSAIAALARHGRVRRTSRRYRSAPVGYLDQPAFLNQVVELETALPPRALFHALKDIEQELGRGPGFRNGPRIIDLDILLYDELEVNDPDLRIPHPRMLERAFVLRPLAELTDRVAGRPVETLLAAVAGQDASPLEDGEEDVA